METTKRAWLVRPRPHEKYRMQEFKSQNLVAIGWPGIGDITGMSREDLKQTLAHSRYQLSGLALGNAYATVDILLNQMQKDDLVLVADGADIYIGKISGDYYFDHTVDSDVEGYPHQRPVTWLTSLSRSDLSKELRYALKVHRTAANLSHHFEEINALAHGQSYVPSEHSTGSIAVSYPLRPNFNIQFDIPNDITRDEAQRLSSYFSSLYFTE